MRITNNMMISNMIRNLQTNIRRLDKAQMQHYTGKRIHRPSDDPVGITRSLKIRADINELKQYKKNVEDAMSWLENTEEAIISNYKGLERLRGDLAVQGANGVYTPEDMIKIQKEITEIKNQLISCANTTYSGDYIFSGKNTDEKLLNSDGSYNVNIMQFLDPNIVDHRINYEVGVGEYIPINTVGTTLFEAVDLTMTVQLPTEDDEPTKTEFLGAEISLTREAIEKEGEDTDSPDTIIGYKYNIEIKIGDDINETIEIAAKVEQDEEGEPILDGNDREIILEIDTKAEIYKEISGYFNGIIYNDDSDNPTVNTDNIEKWNKLLIEKNIPVDINNLNFGTYENDGQAVGIVAKPIKAGLINLIERIEENLKEGKHEEVSALLGPLDLFLDQSLVVRGTIGAKINRVELISDRIDGDIINLRELQSKLEDADFEESVIQLMNEENVYRAALSVGARIIQPTLLDFLR
ncbi:MAG: flagellar hook-associated protein FlgL [Candidatus Alkaliphilus sp. MAG34]|nr:flagellar hook-associated protein FlgL [Clostridiales bacterium]